MQPNSTFKDKYKIEEILGSGGFGTVYKMRDLDNGQTFAIKIDKKRKGNVKQESEILIELQGGEGIPKIFEIGETEEFSYMIMELLGEPLSKIQKSQGGKMRLDSAVCYLTQALTRLEFIHSIGIVHRDLKPQQLLTNQNDLLYLIDFGLARKFIVRGLHISYQNNCSRAGNSTYASINNHIGIHQTRRDDIESLSYIAVSMLIGRLPWQQSSKLSSSIKWNNVCKIKSAIPLHSLCESCPSEFISFIQYSRSLNFNEKPDYEYLKRLLKLALNKVSFNYNPVPIQSVPNLTDVEYENFCKQNLIPCKSSNANKK